MDVDILCRRDDSLALRNTTWPLSQTAQTVSTAVTVRVTQSPSFTSETTTQMESNTMETTASTSVMNANTLSSTEGVISPQYDTTAQPGDLGAQDQSKRANKQSEADLTPLLVGKCTKTRLALKFYRWHNQVQYSFLI